jgi:hypothetical protein
MAYPENTGLMTLRYNDYTAERSTVSLLSTLLTAANFDAQAAAALALRDAIAGVTDGLLVGFDFGTRYQTVSPSTPSAVPSAQREAKWLVTYYGSDDSGPYRVEIPCPDFDYLDVNNRGYMDISQAPGSTFVSAFEAFVKLPGDVAVTVESVKHVGRNI